MTATIEATRPTPFNLRRQDASDAAIEAAVDYAIAIADSYALCLANVGARELPGVIPTVDGRTVLDIGPGPTLGTAVLMACAGARVTVADIALVGWDPNFHPRFYSRLLERVNTDDLRYTAPIRRLLAAGDFAPDVITLQPVPAEELAGTGRTHEIIFSNSMFEHVEDVPLAIGNLWTVTPPGGRGLHHIDFRDHRDFADPLRYLTLDHATFEAIKNEPFGNFGTQLRIADFVRCFEAAGFVVTAVSPDPQRASAEYIAELRPHLQPEFRDLPESELNVLGGWICVKRPKSAI